MKFLFVVINILLFCAVLWAVGDRVSGMKKNQTEYTVVKRNLTAPKKHTPVGAAKPMQSITTPSESDSDLESHLIENNIFNQERCPNATMPTVNTRIELSLVGIISVGETKGAIIKQKNPNSQNNRMTNTSRNQQNNTQNRQFSGFRTMGMASGNQTTNGRNTSGMPMMPMMPMMPWMNQDVASSGTQQSYKQYVRVGETLANGYTLTEVSRSKAVLTRGNDRVELELLAASVNLPAAAPANNGNIKAKNDNSSQMNQQLLQSIQNLQRFQSMQQGMQMMQMMRQNNVGPNSQPNSGGTRSGNFGGSRRGGN